MKKVLFLVLMGLVGSTFARVHNLTQIYDPNLVEISSSNYLGNKYVMVSMDRKGDRVKAKYFAAKDNGVPVYDRYERWKMGKNVILVSSGTYMDGQNNPVGLTIDNGKLVNSVLAPFDGVVVVYATGGIAVSNLREGNLSMKCDGVNKVFNLKNDFDKQSFIDCASKVEATVFQTHLLIYKNQILVKDAAPTASRERRFLAVCKDDEGNIRHVIMNSPTNSTLQDCTKKVFKFLTELKEMKEVVFMINLDVGAQDVFKLYNNDGSENYEIKGTLSLDKAANLLSYYYN